MVCIPKLNNLLFLNNGIMSFETTLRKVGILKGGIDKRVNTLLDYR